MTAVAPAAEGGAAPEAHHLRRLADLTLPMAIRVAATLRLADLVAAGERTTADLARATRTDPDALDRMMRYLVTAGVFSRDADGYALTGLSTALTDEHPYGVRGFLDIDGAIGRANLAVSDLLHTVRTGRPAYPHRYGQGFWEDLSGSPALAASFDALMAKKHARTGRAICTAYDWGKLGHVVDVGGGTGTLSMTLLEHYPALRVTLVEQRGPASAARKRFASSGLAGRADVTVRSFFDPLPPGADGYLLCDVLHDWNDPAAETILRRCAEAAGDTGSIFVIEMNGPAGEGPDARQDLKMLTWFGGRERDVTAVAALARHVGLAVAAVHDAAPMSVIELAGHGRAP